MISHGCKNVLILILFSFFLTSNESKLNESQEKPVAIYQFTRHGVGSNLVNMMAHKAYFEGLGYIFMVDDQNNTRYHYHGVGIINTFFTPTFDVIQDSATLQKFLERPTTYYIDDFRVRAKIKEKYPYRKEGAYTWLLKEFCENLQFNEKAKIMIADFKEKHKKSYEYGKGYLSAGFHIRRGDKLLRESRKFEAREYVDKLLSLDSGSKVKQCFISSDDFEAVEEMREALIKNNVLCKVYSLVRPKQHGNDAVSYLSNFDVLEFMTEISLLVESTYFIGSFNSNVGAIVSLLRGCHHGDMAHYANSFAVDKDHFYYK